MKKDKLLQLVNKEWAFFQNSLGGLTDDILQQSKVIGDWSIRDIMTHITSWEQEALKALPLILDKKPVHKYTECGGIDGFNAQEQERKKHYTLDVIRQELSEIHEKLLKYLINTSDGAFLENKSFTKRIYWDAYGHYRQHYKQILAWRQNNGL